MREGSPRTGAPQLKGNDKQTNKAVPLRLVTLGMTDPIQVATP